MTLENLQSQVRELTNTDTTSYTNDQINANLTRWAHLFTTEIVESQDEWEFQGETATTDLVADQQEYPFPSDILKIKRIEITYDGTNWYRANIWDISERGSSIDSEHISDFSEEEPYAELFNGSVFMYPVPDEAQTAGLKIWYSEEIVGEDSNGDDITSFSTSTDKPKIREAFQRGLILGAVKDNAQKYQNWDLFKISDNEQEKIISRMKQFYSNRIQDRKIIVKTASKLENYE
jgi:hypothetical protein